MPDESKPLVKITQWRGLASNAEARHLPPGAAQIQRNFQTTVPGRLTCRKGLQPTEFGTFKAGSDVIGLYTYQVHGKDYVIYEATDNSDDADGGAGTIMAGEGSTLIELVTDYFNDAFRVSFAKSRHNSLIMVNGIDRGKMWDGNDVGTGKAVELGIDPPAGAPAVGVGNDANGGSGSTAGDYVCYYRYVDHSAAPLYSNLSPVRELDSVAGGKQFNWTGLSASFQDNAGSGRIRFVELYRSTAGQSTTVYRIQKIGYDGNITAITTSASSNYTITSKDHGLIVGSIVTITGIDGTGGIKARLNTTGLAVSAKTTNTFTITDAGAVGTYTSGGVWTLTGFGVDGLTGGEDALDDPDINTAAITTPATALRILNPDGTLNANRHTVPPFHMSVAVQFQDRMFYAVPVKLDEGTCSTNSNTTINVFSNTINSTVTDYSALKDRYITILDGNNEPLPFKITAQPDKVSVTVDRSAKKTATLKKYVIEAAPTERRKVYYSEADLPESVPTVNDTIVQENTGDDDDMTGLMPHGSYLYGLFERHIYRMSFVRQPQLDIQWTLVASRGCFNQACWDRYADLAFLMDQSGPYIVTLISPVPKVIGEEVQDLWRDAKIDFSKSKWFFTKVDPLLQVCRFYYCHTDDNSARPKRAIVYHWPSGAWWEETYPIELGGATTVAIAGQLRTVVGGEDELVLLTHEKTIDIVTEEIRNNVESSTPTVLTDTGVFGSDDSKIGAPVAIISGTGKGQIRTITDNDANTITTAAWTKKPDNTSTYLVGAIEYQFKSGLFEFPVTESRSQRKLEIIFGTTAGADTMELRHYLDNSSTAVKHTPGQNKGDGVTIDNDTLHPVVDLKLTRSGLGDQPGFAHIMFSGNRPEDTQAARFIAAEVHGFQGASEIVLSEMSVGGAS